MSPEGAQRLGREAFKPITWSAKDTPPTVQQIKVHNEVGVKLGLWQPPPTKQKSWFRRVVKPKVAQVKPKPIVSEPPEPVNATAKSPTNDPRDPTPWYRR